MTETSRPVRRIVVAATAAAVVVAGAVTTATAGDRTGNLVSDYDRSVQQATEVVAEAKAEAPSTTGPHSHTDPSTKNDVSRAGETTKNAQDPTSAAEKIANASAVAVGRRTPEPTLTTTPADQPRANHPATRYAMANGCYTLVEDGEPLFFKPTRLGDYLLYDADRRFVTFGGEKAAEPSGDTIWTATRDRRRTRLTHGDETLTVDGSSRFLLTRATGCAPYPESQINISGDPFAGTSPFQEVRGYADAHTHGMAYEFLGGGAHCGKPWDKFGAPYALVDCPDHRTGTNPLEAVLSGEPTHDPVGWPTFADWPAPNSLTHEGTYYKWMERSWRGGQRLFVNLLVENNQLCTLYPFGPGGSPVKNSCDDMDSVRLQAKRMYQLQDYIDAQWGGPGQGWYRIVKNPWQARRVINGGKMAIVMGIETSVPFGCTFKAGPGGDTPAAECDKKSIDKQLAEVHRLGVRQMELVNKFDNALSGVTGDSGQTGVVVNSGNRQVTGHFWDMRQCPAEAPHSHGDQESGDQHDKTQPGVTDATPGGGEGVDALAGRILDAFGGVTKGYVAPAYGPGPHCNDRGLTPLGKHLIRAMIAKGMIFDPDHMSARAQREALDMVERETVTGGKGKNATVLPAVMSSHSWGNDAIYQRIYELSGVVAPRTEDAAGFVNSYLKHKGFAAAQAPEGVEFGLGYGADTNGLGGQPGKRNNAQTRVDYANGFDAPIGGVRLQQQKSGLRTFDINNEGVAQYGLFADWFQELRLAADEKQPGLGATIIADMLNGPETYLSLWERAVYGTNSCVKDQSTLQVEDLHAALGLNQEGFMDAIGQPASRDDDAYIYCAQAKNGAATKVAVQFDQAGRVTAVTPRG